MSQASITRDYFMALTGLHIDLAVALKRAKSLPELAGKEGEHAVGAHICAEVEKLLNHVGENLLRLWNEIQAAKKEGE
jgi:hypothetical protein